jgi:hypothetical protein
MNTDCHCIIQQLCHDNNTDFIHFSYSYGWQLLTAAEVFLEDLLFRGAGSADANLSDHLLLRALSMIIRECEAIGKNEARYTKHKN